MNFAINSMKASFTGIFNMEKRVGFFVCLTVFFLAWLKWNQLWQ